MHALGQHPHPRLSGPVIGVGVGGSRLRIYTSSRHDIAKDVPRAFGDVRTEVIETSGFVIQGTPSPSVSCGVSVGRAQPASTGTLGCLVRDDQGRHHILSNNHVLAANNAGVSGDPIVHPGPDDGGASPANDIATLGRFQPIDFGTGSNNHIDAAIGEPIANVAVSSNIVGLGRPRKTTAKASALQRVRKHGRTTGLTTGEVRDVSFNGYVHYGSRLAWFEDQIGIVGLGANAFSDGGDSGALILEYPTNQPVGLLFAGDGRQTLANPIDLVLTDLGVSIVGV